MNYLKQGRVATDSDNRNLTALPSKLFQPLPTRNQQRAQIYMTPTQGIESEMYSIAIPLSSGCTAPALYINQNLILAEDEDNNLLENPSVQRRPN